MKLTNWSTVCITLLHLCVPNSVQYMKTRHHIKAPQRDAVKRKHRKNYGKLTFVFFNRSFLTQKFVDSNAWITHFSCFKEDKRIQDNCETVQHERTVFLSRQKLQKLSKRKNIDTNLTNQNKYINIPLAWIWFVYSFISFAFLLQAQGRIWCVQEIPREADNYLWCWYLRCASQREPSRKSTTGAEDLEKEGRSLVEELPMYERHRRLMNKKRRTKGKTRRVKHRRPKMDE